MYKCKNQSIQLIPSDENENIYEKNKIDVKF